MTLPVLIAGGGIGGLALALMLEQRGIAAQVFEAAPEMRALGVGINVLPHSIRELAALGLLDRLDAIAIRTRSLTYANHFGQTIWTEPRGIFAGDDAPQFSAHRGRLQALLWQVASERLGPASPRLARRLTDFTTTDDGVVARFVTPTGAEEVVAGSALIGADGIHSHVRTTLHHDDAGIRWNGIQMWRGAVEWPLISSGDTMIIAGDGVAKLVLYPIAPGETPGTRLTNWVIYARTGHPHSAPPHRESWSRRGRYEAFAPLAGRLSLPFVDVAALVQATAEIFEYPMCDRDPLPWWTQGRVTLLGDAAHAMYPVGSNGASQAILDARCLADLLVRLPVPDALAAYDAERRPLTAAIVHSNRGGGPERVIDLAAARAPGGFDAIGDVVAEAELAEIVGGYARLAGFARSDAARP